MNETLNTILSRRSIRKFEQTQIKDEELNTILEAGNIAPSAMNQQSWHFTVVQNEGVLNKIVEAIRTAFKNSGIPNFEARAKDDNFSPFYNAPTFIIVTGNEKAIAPIHDGSLAIGNMMNAAHSLGVGTCWIHAVNFLFGTEEGKLLKGELGIPEDYIPVGSIAVGYKAIDAPAAPPRKENTVNIIK